MNQSPNFSLQQALDEINKTKEHYLKLDKKAATIHRRENLFLSKSVNMPQTQSQLLKKQNQDIEASHARILLPKEFLTLQPHDKASLKWHLPAFQPSGEAIVKDNKDKADLYRELLLNQLPNVKLVRSSSKTFNFTKVQ